MPGPSHLLKSLGILFVVFLPHAAEAAPCKEQCRGLAHLGRKARLYCELACEKKDPSTIEYCPEYTPCLLACEERLPTEQMANDSLRDEKTKCNGVCMTKYFKIDCQNAPPARGGPAGGGNASRGPLPEAQPVDVVATARQSDAPPAKQKEPPASSAGNAHAQNGTESSAASAQNTPQAKAGEPIKISEPKESTPVAELVKSMLVDPAELGLFERVKRKYLEKWGALRNL